MQVAKHAIPVIHFILLLSHPFLKEGRYKSGMRIFLFTQVTVHVLVAEKAWFSPAYELTSSTARQWGLLGILSFPKLDKSVPSAFLYRKGTPGLSASSWPSSGPDPKAPHHSSIGGLTSRCRNFLLSTSAFLCPILNIRTMEVVMPCNEEGDLPEDTHLFFTARDPVDFTGVSLVLFIVCQPKVKKQKWMFHVWGLVVSLS